MIRLTDEEFIAEFKKMEESNAIVNMPWMWGKQVAQAQLKKVAEWLQELPTDGHNKWHWYHQDLARTLLKECEE